MPIAPNLPCPCGSGNKYKKCCRPYHKGALPPTPEALMRSRYTAYVASDMTYIMDTTHPTSEWHRDDRTAWKRELERITKDSQYVALTIKNSQLSENGSVGWVTFHAGILQNGKDASFTEKSRFEKHDGRWKYAGGEFL